MSKVFNWVLAATLVCGSSVFTACSNNDDEPEQQKATNQERTEFVEHTRAMTKDLAENLNFSSWEAANNFNTFLNLYVLDNPNFQKSILNAFTQEATQNVQPVEEGSELAKAGFQYYATIDLTNFNYRFTMNDANNGFDMEPAADFEVLLNGYNPKSQQFEKGVYKVTLKTTGTTMTRVSPMPNMEGTALLMKLGSEFQFALSSKLSGSWNDDFSGTMHYQVPEGATDGSKGFTADAVIHSNIIGGTLAENSDKTQLDLSIASDRVKGVATGRALWTQNGRKMLELSVKESGNYMGIFSQLDMSKFRSTASFFELVGSVMGSRSIDEAKLTLLDDLTTTFSIRNLGKILELEEEYRTVGRNYATKEAIDEYTRKFNELVTAEIYCKGTNQTLPMRLVTSPVGIDYWTVYGFKFSDEQDYVSMLSLLDRKTFAYMLNIMDHSVDHMQESVIAGRLLLQYALTIFGIQSQVSTAD